jgi:hypothetical protein
MSEKVKVSVFLDEEVAKAAKVQAAREGSGVSEIVRNVFLCAHCGEPITNEFVVGPPKLVAPNLYRVFFHKDRKECLKATGPRVQFLATCPDCQKPAHQDFERTKLFDLLQKKKLKFYCIQSDSHWFASQEENEAVARLLGEWNT